MKNWIVGTIIAGSIFYVLCEKVNTSYKKVVDKDYAIVASYTDLLSK